MVLIVTDTGWFWNHENPLLEKYKDIVTVISLSGKKITDKYECWTCRLEKYIGKAGSSNYGSCDPAYRFLKDIGDTFSYREDVIFLTDSEPTTLYPFRAIAGDSDYNRYHLVAMAPFAFDTHSKRRADYEMLSNLSVLNTLFYLDSEQMDSIAYGSNNIEDVRKALTEYFDDMLPRILMGICESHETWIEADHPYTRQYFDFNAGRYMPVADGFSIDFEPIGHLKNRDGLKFARMGGTLGFGPIEVDAPDGMYSRDKAESLGGRINGKKICNVLREQRIRLADANGIPFESHECPSIGPCAGTCAKCEAEVKYLADKLDEIPYEKRIYPYFNPAEEMNI